MRGEAQIDRERGRDLPNGISQKCKIGRHEDCTADHCNCPCLHGAIPSLLNALTADEQRKAEAVRLAEPFAPEEEIHIDLPSGGIAKVSPQIKPETVSALDQMMQAAIAQAVADGTAYPDESTRHIRLERTHPSDKVYSCRSYCWLRLCLFNGE